MRIVPVLDLKGGFVVAAVGGRRQEYQPIVSRLTSSAEPLAVARAFREHLGFEEIYLADLDAIANQPPALALYAELIQHDFRVWVDAGRWSIDKPELLRGMGVDTVIAGLESLTGPQELATLVREQPADR